jgi:hypothetical protein
MITLYKKVKISYKGQFLINLMLKDEIKKNYEIQFSKQSNIKEIN